MLDSTLESTSQEQVSNTIDVNTFIELISSYIEMHHNNTVRHLALESKVLIHFSLKKQTEVYEAAFDPNYSLTDEYKSVSAEQNRTLSKFCHIRSHYTSFAQINHSQVEISVDAGNNTPLDNMKTKILKEFKTLIIPEGITEKEYMNNHVHTMYYKCGKATFVPILKPVEDLEFDQVLYDPFAKDITKKDGNFVMKAEIIYNQNNPTQIDITKSNYIVYLKLTKEFLLNSEFRLRLEDNSETPITEEILNSYNIPEGLLVSYRCKYNDDLHFNSNYPIVAELLYGLELPIVFTPSSCLRNAITRQGYVYFEEIFLPLAYNQIAPQNSLNYAISRLDSSNISNSCTIINGANFSGANQITEGIRKGSAVVVLNDGQPRPNPQTNQNQTIHQNNDISMIKADLGAPYSSQEVANVISIMHNINVTYGEQIDITPTGTPNAQYTGMQALNTSLKSEHNLDPLNKSMAQVVMINKTVLGNIATYQQTDLMQQISYLQQPIDPNTQIEIAQQMQILQDISKLSINIKIISVNQITKNSSLQKINEFIQLVFGNETNALRTKDFCKTLKLSEEETENVMKQIAIMISEEMRVYLKQMEDGVPVEEAAAQYQDAIKAKRAEQAQNEQKAQEDQNKIAAAGIQAKSQEIEIRAKELEFNDKAKTMEIQSKTSIENKQLEIKEQEIQSNAQLERQKIYANERSAGASAMKDLLSMNINYIKVSNDKQTDLEIKIKSKEFKIAEEQDEKQKELLKMELMELVTQYESEEKTKNQIAALLQRGDEQIQKVISGGLQEDKITQDNINTKQSQFNKTTETILQQLQQQMNTMSTQQQQQIEGIKNVLTSLLQMIQPQQQQNPEQIQQGEEMGQQQPPQDEMNN